jgi:hypothetical protein
MATPVNADPDTPMFRSERHDTLTGFCARVGLKALRRGSRTIPSANSATG